MWYNPYKNRFTSYQCQKFYLFIIYCPQGITTILMNIILLYHPHVSAYVWLIMNGRAFIPGIVKSFLFYIYYKNETNFDVHKFRWWALNIITCKNKILQYLFIFYNMTAINFFELPRNITLQNIDRLTIIWYIENKQKVQIWLEIKLMLLKPRNY